jgi:hypothetical protein
MSINISPGVYSKIIDLSTFVQVVPATIGFIAGLTRKGRDNQLVFVGSRSEFMTEWGEPNINDYTKNYGQGPYIAYNHLGESGSLYWMRCLPDDATYSNLKISARLEAEDSTASISITYVDSINNTADLKTALAPGQVQKPLCILYPIGRGDYYNGLGVRFTQHSNPTLNGIYVLDIYERQSEGTDAIIESFEVSFDPYATDVSGDSIFISYVLSTYSSVLRAEMQESDGDYTSGYDLVIRTYDKDAGSVTIILEGYDDIRGVAFPTLRDTKQDFSDWETETETGNANYLIIAKDGKGIEIWGWLGGAIGEENDEIVVFKERNLSVSDRGWNGDVSSFSSSNITYEIKKARANIATPFVSAIPKPLKKGSEGSLRAATGVIDPTTAESLLEQAYSGLLTGADGNYVDSILDTDLVYFSIVYDAGYPSDVKTAISTLCNTRRDCIAIIDNGDNSTFELASSKRTAVHTFNNYYVSIYEPFNKVSDIFSGNDIWVSPVYHLSYLLPRNDNIAEIWFAAAGFNRGAIESIKELRFNPKLGQRDQMYLKQLNPICKFSAGYVVWGQLTSQAKASAMQDLNIVRLVLYAKKAIEQYCRNFIFEQNDPITWGQVAGAITDFLEVIKNRRGLDNFSIDVGATEYEKKTKTFHVNVTLQPTRVVEKIELNFYIK